MEISLKKRLYTNKKPCYNKSRLKAEIIVKGWKEVSNEKMAVFKGYLRSLMRQLKLLKKAIYNNELEEAKKLIDELIDDTQNNIED